MSANGIATQFVSHYYTLMDALNWDALTLLYHPEVCLLSFEGGEYQGREAIANKLKGLPFKKLQHIVTTVDAQPLPFGNVLLIFVIGQLKTDDDPPHSFSQAFVLKVEENSAMLINDVFRLSLHHG